MVYHKLFMDRVMGGQRQRLSGVVYQQVDAFLQRLLTEVGHSLICVVSVGDTEIVVWYHAEKEL